MQHLAIDLGGRESQVCIRDERGKILSESRVTTGGLEALLRSQPPSRVVMETCSESFTVAGWAKALGHEVRIVPAAAVRALGVGARGLKNDVRDAQVLSDVSTKVDLYSVHMPSELSRERKARCTAREALVEARTMPLSTPKGPPDFQGQGTRGVHRPGRSMTRRAHARRSSGGAQRRRPGQRLRRRMGCSGLVTGAGGGGLSSVTLGLSLER
jgi:hypothetical protein